jgi:hypothetical protein
MKPWCHISLVLSFLLQWQASKFCSLKPGMGGVRGDQHNRYEDKAEGIQGKGEGLRSRCRR